MTAAYSSSSNLIFIVSFGLVASLESSLFIHSFQGKEIKKHSNNHCPFLNLTGWQQKRVVLNEEGDKTTVVPAAKWLYTSRKGCFFVTAALFSDRQQIKKDIARLCFIYDIRLDTYVVKKIQDWYTPCSICQVGALWSYERPPDQTTVLCFYLSFFFFFTLSAAYVGPMPGT